MDQHILDILQNYPPLMKTAQVCKAIDLNRKTVYKLIRNGEIPASIVGKGYRITRESVIDYWRRVKMKGKGENESENQ